MRQTFADRQGFVRVRLGLKKKKTCAADWRAPRPGHTQASKKKASIGGTALGGTWSVQIHYMVESPRWRSEPAALLWWNCGGKRSEQVHLYGGAALGVGLEGEADASIWWSCSTWNVVLASAHLYGRAALGAGLSICEKLDLNWPSMKDSIFTYEPTGMIGIRSMTYYLADLIRARQDGRRQCCGSEAPTAWEKEASEGPFCLWDITMALCVWK